MAPAAPAIDGELLARLNAGRGERARLYARGAIAFGRALSVERLELGNGLRVLVLIDRSAPVVSYQTWFGVGSRHERPGKTGLAHLFEHLMFNETENLPYGTFDRTLEEAGAETNAATWVDWTYYHENLPRDAVEVAVRLESERMSRLVLREKQVASEREVVANERRLRVEDDIDGAVSELLYRTAFQEHAYGWPTIGWMEDIQGFSTVDCEEFYRTYYAPNNAAVVVVGDVEPEPLLRAMQDHYGDLPPSRLPVEDVHPEPPQTSERRVRIEKPTATHKVAVGFKGPALGDFDHPPLTLLNEILFGGRSSRVHRALVQEREVAIEARGWVSTFRDPGLYDIYLTARGSHTGDHLVEALDEVLAQVLERGVTPEELERAQARVELATLHGLETVGGKAEQIGFHETVLGDPAAVFARLEGFRRVTVSDLLRAARRYLRPTSRSLVLVTPEGGGGEANGADAEGDGTAR